MQIKTNSKALVPPVIAVVSFLLSPEFYNLLPDKASHLIAALAVFWAAFQSPAVRKYVEIRQDEEKTVVKIEKTGG